MVSVIIPYYNAQKTLVALTGSLKKQSHPSKAFEVLFIDNRSKDSGEILIGKELDDSQFLFTLLSFNDYPSSYAARNCGVEHSKGDILIFTDADCVPSQRWLEAMDENFQLFTDRDVVLSGRVELLVEDESNPWELFDRHFHMDNENAETSGRVATANMAVRKELFERIGPFKEVVSGGDHEWSRRARKAGAEIISVPEALVYHPTRKTRNEILKKLNRTSAGLGELSRSSSIGFIKGFFKTILRPFLFNRHIQFAGSSEFKGSFGFRLKLFWLSFLVRCYQIPPFFRGLMHKK